jgi:hypothetical protein
LIEESGDSGYGEFLKFDLHPCLAMVEVLTSNRIVSRKVAATNCAIDAMDDGDHVRCKDFYP